MTHVGINNTRLHIDNMNAGVLDSKVVKQLDSCSLADSVRRDTYREGRHVADARADVEQVRILGGVTEKGA